MENFRNILAEILSIPADELFEKDLLLSEVIAMSPNATNSIDVLEGFAGALAELQWDELVDLPAFTLENTIDSVIQEIEHQVANKEV